jgi:hypothetical protein
MVVSLKRFQSLYCGRNVTTTQDAAELHFLKRSPVARFGGGLHWVSGEA